MDVVVVVRSQNWSKMLNFFSSELIQFLHWLFLSAAAAIGQLGGRGKCAAIWKPARQANSEKIHSKLYER